MSFGQRRLGPLPGSPLRRDVPTACAEFGRVVFADECATRPCAVHPRGYRVQTPPKLIRCTGESGTEFSSLECAHFILGGVDLRAWGLGVGDSGLGARDSAAGAGPNCVRPRGEQLPHVSGGLRAHIMVCQNHYDLMPFPTPRESSLRNRRESGKVSHGHEDVAVIKERTRQLGQGINLRAIPCGGNSEPKRVDTSAELSRSRRDYPAALPSCIFISMWTFIALRTGGVVRCAHNCALPAPR